MKLPFLFHSRYISCHFVVDVIWRLPAWNVKLRRYLASCTLQFGSNLTKIIFQGKHFNYFIVVSGWHHVFWSDTHYSISLRYTCNIVQLNSFYIKFDSCSVSCQLKKKHDTEDIKNSFILIKQLLTFISINTRIYHS